MLTIDRNLNSQYPHLPFGIMIMNHVQNPKIHSRLEEEKATLEKSLTHRYGPLSRTDLKTQSPLNIYNDFYKSHKKTYHVQLQLESIVHKNKSFPKVAALVEAMFMAEIKNQLLTAGYDYDTLSAPLVVHGATEGITYMGMGNQEKKPPQNDIILSDQNGILGSVLCGPNHMCRITDQTTKILFAVYGLPGISHEQIKAHFEDIAHYVRLIASEAVVEELHIL